MLEFAIAFFPLLATAVHSYGSYRRAKGGYVGRAYKWFENGLFIIVGLEILILSVVWIGATRP